MNPLLHTLKDEYQGVVLAEDGVYAVQSLCRKCLLAQVITRLTGMPTDVFEPIERPGNMIVANVGVDDDHEEIGVDYEVVEGAHIMDQFDKGEPAFTFIGKPIHIRRLP